ncbi:MAG: nuclear transport factor 2 family protein [Solirubrobacterales bacterium]|nr:nuclear transport factor 2 family protein [Solirubrobacterales bacterium]
MDDRHAKLASLRAIFEGFNAHDLDAILSHFATDCVLELPRGPEPWGRRFEGIDEVRRGLAARFEGIPDVRYESHGDFADGNRGVSEWTISGTTTDGERVEVRGCDIWTFTPGGRIAVKNSFWKIRE